MSEKESSVQAFAKEVVRMPADEWVDIRYLIFSLYVITSRALVAADGLKTVTRRTLFSMYEDGGASPNADHVKAARVAAGVGRYHPHGNSSVEDALAKLAQKFNLRVPLIEAQGNVGYSTGDQPAAARYWEAKMSKAAVELVRDLKEHAMPLGKNYDQKLDEAYSLPVRFPNEIINGTQGIAVGYSSNMVAHNPDEVMDACIALIKNGNEMTVEELMKIMIGPDFPTGGIVMGVEGIKDYFSKGKGTVTVRGRYRKTNLPRGKVSLDFYELPYGVSPGSVKEAINSGKSKGQFKDIVKFEDYSDRSNGLSFVIETRSGANVNSVLNELYSKAKIQTKIPINSVVLVDNVPVTLGIVDLLRGFIEFRRICNTNKCNYNVQQLIEKDKQLDAILKVLVDLDKAISIIRNSEDSSSAKEELQKNFSIDEVQADYILAMQLKRLTKADAISIENQSEETKKSIQYYKDLLSSPELMDKHIISELEETKKVISDPRRTRIIDLNKEEFKEEEEAIQKAAKSSGKPSSYVVTRLANGKLLRTSDGVVSDSISYSIPFSKEEQDVVVITSDGNGHRMPSSYLVDGIPQDSKTLGLKGEVSVVGFSKTSAEDNRGILLATKKGTVKISKTDFPKHEEFPVIGLDSDDSLVEAIWLEKDKSEYDVVCVSSDGNCLIFDCGSLRLAGSKAKGVSGMRIKEGSELIHISLAEKNNEDLQILTYTGDSLKSTMKTDIPLKGRGGQGVSVHKFLKGETHLESSTVTENPLITQDNGSKIVAPAPSRRAASGNKIGIPGLILGEEPKKSDNSL